jgi:hypothetical protein
MKTPHDRKGERSRSHPLLPIINFNIRTRLTYYRQAFQGYLRLYFTRAILQLENRTIPLAEPARQIKYNIRSKFQLLVLQFKKFQERLLKLSPFTPCPVSPGIAEDRVLVVMGGSSTCPRCGGGPLLFEKAALSREVNTCPICTRQMQASDYRSSLLECTYIVMEELCEKCGLPRYAESQVDWVRVSLVCQCEQGSVKVGSPWLRQQIKNALVSLNVAVPENLPPRGTKKIICPFSGKWHKDPAVLYYKTGRMVCWTCRKMTSLLNLLEPANPEAQAIAAQVRTVSQQFWEQSKPEKPKAVAVASPEPTRQTRRELIDLWFSEKGYIPQRMASRYQQWLQFDQRIALPVRPIPNWPPLVYSATVQRATHLERPGTTVHFIKGAVVTDDYTRSRQLIGNQESFWEDDSRHIVAELKVMDTVGTRWEQQVYGFFEKNDHLLAQWTRSQGRIFCGYVQTEAIPGITEWAWGTGFKTPDFVLLSVSANNKLLVSICDVKLSARAWTSEHDQQLSPENFKELLHNYPALIDQLLDTAYFAAPRLQQQGLKIEWPGDQAEFLQWLDQERIQIQVGFRAIPDLPSRRHALLLTREKALYYNGNGRYAEQNSIPDRPYLLVPCCLASLYKDIPGARLAEELLNFDGVGRLRGQIGNWERLWLYEKYSRRGLALAYLLRRKGWDTSNPARLRYSLYECAAQLGVTTSSQYLSQLLTASHQRNYLARTQADNNG